MKEKLGVIIGRFQLPNLHEGHLNLIRRVYEKSDKVLVLIGTGIVRSERNPYSYSVRSKTVLQDLQHYFDSNQSWEDRPQNHGISTRELRDTRYDESWVKQLDDILEEYDQYDVTLFGSRDSFIPTYKLYNGKFKTEELPPEIHMSASEVREKLKSTKLSSQGTKIGYLKAIQEEFSAHYAVVDAIITDGTSVVLGRKKSGWCLIGGFADACDFDLEAAVKREVKEETNLVVSNPVYLMSDQTKDWRYEGTRQPFTVVFVLKVTGFEGLKAGDDILETRVVPLNKVDTYISPSDSHFQYIERYVDYKSI